jgi:hypothetical protein
MPEVEVGMQWLIANVNRVQYHRDPEKQVWVVVDKKTGKVLGKGKLLALALQKAAEKER